MRILVTGGCGFLGSNFLSYSLKYFPDYQYVVLDSLTYASRLHEMEEIRGDFRFVFGDVRSIDSVLRAAEGCDLIVHFAAETHNDNSLREPRKFIETNVLGTLNVLEVARELGARVHLVSTDEVFGSLSIDDKEIFSENSRFAPSSPYSSSKAAADLITLAWKRSFGLSVTVSNCSNNYGPGQNIEKLIPTLIRQAKRGESLKLYGDGLHVRDWIHVDDHSSAIWAIITKGLSGETYCVSTRNERSNLEIAKIIQVAVGSENPIDFIGDRPGHDRRYALDPAKLEKETGWFYPERNMISEIKDLVEKY